MKRYLNSFLITLVLYTGVIFALFTLFTNNKIIINKEKPLQKTISLKHIELVPIPKLEKKVEKVEKLIEKPKEIKKIEPKKVVKKKVVKKPKKVVKKETIKKKAPKVKEVKEVKKEPIKKQIKKPQNTEKIAKVKKVEKIDIKKEYLSKHLSLIRKYINQNVYYPKSAKRLKIQGIVKIRFTLNKNGNVNNIVILSGHSRLKKSTINAVKDAASSFPKVKKAITIELPIEYKLI